MAYAEAIKKITDAGAKNLVRPDATINAVPQALLMYAVCAVVQALTFTVVVVSKQKIVRVVAEEGAILIYAECATDQD